MNETKIVRVRDVMNSRYDIVEGRITVQEAMSVMMPKEACCLIIDKRHEDDEYGILLPADIAKKVVAQDRSPQRVNVYEIMAKPVISVDPSMDIRYCARLFENFGLSLAPVLEDGKVIGVVTYNDMVLRGFN